MGKKRVAVSLRKPPSPEKADAFVAGTQSAAVVTDVAAPEPVAPAPEAAASDALVSAPVVVEVQSAAATPTSTMVDAEGRTLHAVTVWLPADVAERLTMHCLREDRDPSKVIAEALGEHMHLALGPAPEAPVVEPVQAPVSPVAEPLPFQGTVAFATVVRLASRVEKMLEQSRGFVATLRARAFAA